MIIIMEFCTTSYDKYHGTQYSNILVINSINIMRCCILEDSITQITWYHVHYLLVYWVMHLVQNMKWNEMKWNEMNLRWDEMRWDEMRWDEMRWDEMKWNQLNWTELNWTELNWTEMKWNEMKWNEMKWNEMKCSLFCIVRLQETLVGLCFKSCIDSVLSQN